MSRTLRSTFFVAALFAATPLVAQTSAPDARWEPWYGCWRPAGPSLGQAASVVCVAPVASVNGVEITTLRGDTVVSHDSVVADGVHHSLAKQGCTGWQRAQWSDDARRVYLHSDLNCGKDLGRTTDGMLAFSPTGDWLDLQALQAFGSSAVRVVRYQDAGPSVHPPADVAAAIEGRTLQLGTLRQSLGAMVTNKEVIDVAHHVDSTVAAAWISERGQPFALDAKSLVSLADAGVPGGVTDVMLALSYPQELAIQAEGPVVATAADSSRLAAAYMRSRYADSMGFWPYGWGPTYGFGYGYGYYGAYGYCPAYSSLYSPYSYSYSGCGSYFGGYPGGLYGRGYPIGVYGGYGYGVLLGPAVVTPHGVAVKGHGYTKPGEPTTANPSGYNAGGGSARRSTASPDGYSGGSSGSGGSARTSGGSGSSGSGGGGGSSSSGSTGRTAHAGKP